MSADRELIKDIIQHPEDYYVNVHTSVNGGGEIRGNIVNPVAIPEPSTCSALGGLVALGFVAGRRRRV